jgi:hypothetical protein
MHSFKRGRCVNMKWAVTSTLKLCNFAPLQDSYPFVVPLKVV